MCARSALGVSLSFLPPKTCLVCCVHPWDPSVFLPWVCVLGLVFILRNQEYIWFRVSCDTPWCPPWTILYTQSVFSSVFPESAYFFDLIHKWLSNTLDVQEELTLWALFCFCWGNRLNFLMKSMSCLVVVSVCAVFVKLVTRSRYLAIISK